MNTIRKILLSLPLLLAAMTGCAESVQEGDKDTEDRTKTEANAEKILGHWSLREVNNGVLYDVRFREDGTLFQHFESPDGHQRAYDGSYTLSGDTLRTDERRNLSTLIISELTDSVMVLIREDSTAAVFDKIMDNQ